MVLNVSLQITLTADELILHKISVTYDIETILGRFGPCGRFRMLESDIDHIVTYFASIVSILSFALILWKITSSAVKVILDDTNKIHRSSVSKW